MEAITSGAGLFYISLMIAITHDAPTAAIPMYAPRSPRRLPISSVTTHETAGTSGMRNAQCATVVQGRGPAERLRGAR